LRLSKGWARSGDGRLPDQQRAFTRWDLFALIDGLIASRMRYTTLGNGTLMDEAARARVGAG